MDDSIESADMKGLLPNFYKVILMKLLLYDMQSLIETERSRTSEERMLHLFKKCAPFNYCQFVTCTDF